jgi:hypothetical protein
MKKLSDKTETNGAHRTPLHLRPFGQRIGTGLY